jgi:hypothetical protein
MMHGHSFWFFLTWACVVWYATITIYVAYQGSIDIKEMLRRLKQKRDDPS